MPSLWEDLLTTVVTNNKQSQSELLKSLAEVANNTARIAQSLEAMNTQQSKDSTALFEFLNAIKNRF